MPPVFVLPDLFCIFAIVERYNVVITLISTIVFGAPLPTYYQFVIGWMSITNFIKNTIGGLPMRKHENESHTRLLGIINMWVDTWPIGDYRVEFADIEDSGIA